MLARTKREGSDETEGGSIINIKEVSVVKKIEY